MRWSAVLLLLVLWCTPGWVQAQDIPAVLPFAPSDINPGHPQAHGLVLWAVVVPPLAGGPTWYNLSQPLHGTLTNMTAGFGFQPTARPGGWGEMRFDGVDDLVDFGVLTTWDFVNTTFTVMGWFRATTAGYLVSKRDPGGGAWFIRLDGGGTLTARIDGAGPVAAAGRTSSTTTLLDGAWRHFLVIFTTDTVTAANNAVTLYINGLLDQGAQTGTATYATNTNQLGLGCLAQITGCQALSFLTGAMDDVRIYARGVAVTDIAGFVASTPPLFGGLVDPPYVLAFTLPSVLNIPPGVLRFFR